MKVSMKGKVVLITGASRGLGRAISLEFARRGANLALAARSPDGLDQTRQQAKRLGAEVITLQADVSSMEDVNALVRTTVERFGRIDVLVNNAGIARVGGVSGPLFADDVGARGPSLTCHRSWAGKPSRSSALTPSSCTRFRRFRTPCARNFAEAASMS